ncbi:hypothetical protein CDCA_CDCA06G1913 [Cyanidium caldarium]|uniref:Mediator complex subunit 10 n=1 Tax=Cyanidium caldarium TaxID=2771 RepID=A0AAV9IUD7_CYACA|nr:hypothetical protein CDCA_CDCA06G1913 [Cyanidium caldarium]
MESELHVLTADADISQLERELLAGVEALQRLYQLAKRLQADADPSAVRDSVAELVQRYRAMRVIGRQLRQREAGGDGERTQRVPLELLQWLDRGENPDGLLLRYMHDAADLERIAERKRRILRALAQTRMPEAAKDGGAGEVTGAPMEST